MENNELTPRSAETQQTRVSKIFVQRGFQPFEKQKISNSF